MGAAAILSHGQPGDRSRPRASPRAVLVAPDAFKGTLPAAGAATAMALGVRAALPTARVDVVPLADGGDGTLAALGAAGYARRPVITRGPLGVPAVSAVARRGGTRVVELAASCGIALLPPGTRAPMTSTTHGLGDAIAAALDDDGDELVVCLGGSASTDGGTGLLVALGARLLDSAGAPVPAGGAGLGRIARVDLSGLDPRLARCRVVVATDVRSPLLGPDGAAAAFGPQKGASPAQVGELERGLATWASALAEATGTDAADRPGAGAAGGAGLAVIAALHGEVVSGAGFVHGALGLAGRIADADLVVTGEGRLDRTSLLGKGVGEVARLASAGGVPVLAVCGQVALADRDARAAGVTTTVDLVAHAGDAAWRDPASSLTAAVRAALEIGR